MQVLFRLTALVERQLVLRVLLRRQGSLRGFPCSVGGEGSRVRS